MSGSVKAKGNFASVEMELIQMPDENVGGKEGGDREC